MPSTRYQVTGTYMCVLVFWVFSLTAFPLSDPLRVLFFAIYTRTADQNIASPTSTQHSADRAISSAHVAFGIIKSLVTPNHGPILSAPFTFLVEMYLPCASAAGGVSRPPSGALVTTYCNVGHTGGRLRQIFPLLSHLQLLLADGKIVVSGSMCVWIFDNMVKWARREFEDMTFATVFKNLFHVLKPCILYVFLLFFLFFLCLIPGRNPSVFLFFFFYCCSSYFDLAWLVLCYSYYCYSYPVRRHQVPGVSFAFLCSFGIDLGLHSLFHSSTYDIYTRYIFLSLHFSGFSSRVTGVSKSRGSGRVITFQNLTGRAGSGRAGAGRVGSGRVGSKYRGSGRVGSIVFKVSRVGAGRVKRFQNHAGRVGSGQEVFKISRVGSGHDPRDARHSRVKPP